MPSAHPPLPGTDKIQLLVDQASHARQAIAQLLTDLFDSNISRLFVLYPALSAFRVQVHQRYTANGPEHHLIASEFLWRRHEVLSPAVDRARVQSEIQAQLEAFHHPLILSHYDRTTFHRSGRRYYG